MYQKILVPIDGSKSSDNALEHASRLAKWISAINKETQVILLHVIPEVPLPPGFERSMRSSNATKRIPLLKYAKAIQDSFRMTAEEMLSEKKKCEQLSMTPGYSVRTQVVSLGVADDDADKGITISERILLFSNKEKVDLIVIGNVGLRGFRMIKALGSVSRGISERASCPVLIVH
jgi:nucleotide-binding universal stress UspA family protein